MRTRAERADPSSAVDDDAGGGCGVGTAVAFKGTTSGGVPIGVRSELAPTKRRAWPSRPSTSSLDSLSEESVSVSSASEADIAPPSSSR